YLRLVRLTIAKVRIRYREHRAQKLRLLPNIELLFQIKTKTNQLWFMQESAVHQHACWPAVITNAYRERQVWIARDCWPGRVRQVWRDNRVEIVSRECIVDSGARGVSSMCSRGDVIWIVGITRQLFRCFEDVLTVVNQFLLAMRIVECNQIRQRAHVRVRERGEIVCDLRSEFVQQRGKLVIGVSKHVTCVCIHDGRTEAFHHAQRVLSKGDRRFIAWNPAAVVAVIEKANVASD